MFEKAANINKTLTYTPTIEQISSMAFKQYELHMIKKIHWAENSFSMIEQLTFDFGGFKSPAKGIYS